MSERPILFNTEMVHAILEEKKTQTRRVCKLQPHEAAEMTWWPDGKGTDTGTAGGAPGCYLKLCPFGQVGAHLWVRETWQHSNHPYGPLDISCDIFYREEYFDDPHGMDGEKSPEGKYRFWKPSIHMPRWASRIMLEITDVRVERLKDISEEEAYWEGCDHAPGVGLMEPRQCYRRGFMTLWESINGTGSWDVNPWVWVIKFKVITGGVL